MNQITTLVGISGSLRRGSFNTALLRAFGEAMPDDARLELRHVRDLPLYDEDRAEPEPPAVDALRRAIDGADGVVIATPEYNHSIPGVLANAIDWCSRPAFRSPLAGKPVAMLSASLSPVGGARAQTILRLVLGSTLAEVFPHPELTVGRAAGSFDEKGRLIDEALARRLAKFTASFVAWVARR
jgi:chromate reductase